MENGEVLTEAATQIIPRYVIVECTNVSKSVLFLLPRFPSSCVGAIQKYSIA